jgi:hypothetical protein
LLTVFVAFSLSAMTGDVIIAHAYNKFGVWTQWIPLLVGFFVAAIACVGAINGMEQRGQRTAFAVAMWASVALGIVGTFFHVRCEECQGISLKDLVYSAPLTAPLAYSGVAFAGLIAVRSKSMLWGWSRRQWIYCLIALGALANGSLCVLDHARNAFFHPAEWLSIFVSLFIAGLFAHAALHRGMSSSERVVMWVGIGVQALVGVAGWVFHVSGSLSQIEGDLLDKLIYGPPVFAPLLFVNLSVIGAMLMLSSFSDEME